MTGELVLFRPQRLVTRDWCAWWLTQGSDGSLGYTNSMMYGRGQTLTLAEVIADETFGGPVRPVVLPEPYECEYVRTALFEAGKLAVTTLARALWWCVDEVGVAPLVAGRSGSWEAQAMTSFARWGVRVERGRVADGPADALRKQVLRWVSDPLRYVEVAARLSVLFSEMAMRHLTVQMRAAADDGVELDPFEIPALLWTSVADRQLWPDAYQGATVGASWHRYLMSNTVGFDPQWFDLWMLQ